MNIWLRPKKGLLAFHLLNDSSAVPAAASAPELEGKTLVVVIVSPFLVISYPSPWASGPGSAWIPTLWTAKPGHRHLYCHRNSKAVWGPPSMVSWLCLGWDSWRGLSECIRPPLYSRFWGKSAYSRITWEIAKKNDQQISWCTVGGFFPPDRQKASWQPLTGFDGVCSAPTWREWCWLQSHLSGPWLSLRSGWCTAMNHSARTAHDCLICVFTSQI